MSDSTPTTATISLRKGCKPSKACSTDKTRPIVMSAYLAKTDDGYEVHATTTYTALRLKVQADGEPDEGFIPADAIKRIEAMKEPSFTAQNGSVQVDAGRVSFRREQHGTYPNLVKLWPQKEAKRPLVIGLNTRLLRELAQAMGTDGVKFELDMALVKDGKYLRPFRVRPLGGPGQDDADGLLMPMRVFP